MEEGDEIIVSTMEHHSNIVPWQLLEMSKGVKVKVIPITEQGELDFEAFENLISNRTKLVSVAHISNVLGTVNPIKRIIDRAHQEIFLFLLMCTGCPHTPIDTGLNRLLCFPHIGFMRGWCAYGKRRWLDKLPLSRRG